MANCAEVPLLSHSLTQIQTWLRRDSLLLTTMSDLRPVVTVAICA